MPVEVRCTAAECNMVEAIELLCWMVEQYGNLSYQMTLHAVADNCECWMLALCLVTGCSKARHKLYMVVAGHKKEPLR